MKKHLSYLLSSECPSRGLLDTESSLRRRTAHLIYFLVLPAYLISFALIEKLVPTEGYWVSYLPHDDLIPFIEQFAIFYYIWYFMLGSLGIHLLLFNGDGFKKYMTYIGIGFGLVVLFCALFPNGQDLRPDLDALGRDNVFTRMMAKIYASDTNTNVLPSMHVVGSFAVLFGVIEAKELRRLRWAIPVTAVLALGVSLSTVFVKQHSILDVYVGVPYAVVIYFLVYHVIFKKRK